MCIKKVNRGLLAWFVAVALTHSAACQGMSQAEMNARFNAIYPDLLAHPDVVGAAITVLNAEGVRKTTTSEMFEAVATRARRNLQLSSRTSTDPSATDGAAFKQRVSAAFEEAQRRFPEVAIPGSPLYERVGAERRKLERTYSDYFKNADWPLMLTTGCLAGMTLEAQEKNASQQKRALTVGEAQEALEMLKRLQEFGKSSSGNK